jgi:hypothetical protein
VSKILDLYPQAWRDRYADELGALLEERPATLLDKLDLIHGAIDARRHPQVPGRNADPEKEIPMNVRLLGAMAAIGGIAWLIAIGSAYILPRNAFGDRDTSIAAIGLAFGIALTGVALGELGSRRGSTASAAVGHTIAVGSIVLGVMITGGWPLVILPLIAFPLVCVGAAIRGSRNGTMPGWLAVAFGIAAIGSYLGSFGIGTEAELGMALLGSIGLAALALAWVALSGHSAGSSEASPA